MYFWLPFWGNSSRREAILETISRESARESNGFVMQLALSSAGARYMRLALPADREHYNLFCHQPLRHSTAKVQSAASGNDLFGIPSNVVATRPNGSILLVLVLSPATELLIRPLR